MGSAKSPDFPYNWTFFLDDIQGDFQIRPAQMVDVANIKQLVQRSYEPYIERMHIPPAPMTYDYHTIVQAGKTWLIEYRTQKQKHIVGLLTLIIMTDAIMLDNVAIDPMQQGVGLGKRLIHFVERYALAQGMHKIILYTNEKMTENIAIYQHLGFRITQKVQELGYSRIYCEKDLVI